MKNFLTATLAGAAALSAGSTVLADEAASRAVWERHVQAATAGDIDAVMADFTEESALITPDGVISGTADIRRFFEDLLGGVEPGALETTVSNAELTHGNILVANFTMWVAARRMKVRAHWLVLVWMLACLFTVIVFGAATPVNMALGLMGVGSFTPLGD